MKREIPLHRLYDKSHFLFNIRHISDSEPLLDGYTDRLPHRDDHYLFFLVENGTCKLSVDFEEITLKSGNLYYILPTQIHHRLEAVLGEGWFIEVDATFIPEDSLGLLKHKFSKQVPVCPNISEFRQLNTIASLLLEKFNETNRSLFQRQTLLALFQYFVCLTAFIYEEFDGNKYTSSRIGRISKDFADLLKKHVRTIKSPSAYASKLNISQAYLNEALKKTTGYSVTYWIQQEVIFEAKRLLYSTDLSVKEIAYSLGYEDQSYFSRLFCKTTSLSAVAFRTLYRK